MSEMADDKQVSEADEQNRRKEQLIALNLVTWVALLSLRLFFVFFVFNSRHLKSCIPLLRCLAKRRVCFDHRKL